LKHDVITLTESKLDSRATYKSLAISGYTLNRQDRTAHGGGVATYVKSCLKPQQMTEHQERFAQAGLEVTVTKITLPRPAPCIVVIGVYRPPQAGCEWFATFDELASEVGSEGALVVMGDLNADLAKDQVAPGSTLVETLTMAGIAIHSKEPTRITATSQTCLDVIATDNRLNCLDYVVGSTSASDHFPVSALVTAPTPTSLQPIVKRSFAKVDYTELAARVQSIDLEQKPDSTPDALLANWEQAFIKILDDLAPVKSLPMRRHRSPWMTAKIRQLMSFRDSLGRKMKTSPSEQLAIQLREARKRVKSNLRREARNQGQEAMTSSDPGASWKFIKLATFTTKGEEPTHVPLPILNEYFSSIVKRPEDDPVAEVASCDRANSFEFKPLREHEVQVALESIKSRTAAGHDQLQGALLKRLAPALATNIATIYNCSFAQNAFPENWKKANVCPVWKGKGSKKEPSSYRPISVLPVLGRCLEKLAAAQLYNYCDNNEIIPREQFGFRRKSSCELALVSAVDLWVEAIDSGAMVGALLVDLSKAFDTVPHQKLLMELASSGCSNNVTEWFRNYLSNRRQRVISHTEVTPWTEVTRGVPQGSCLSPLLFNVFVRDLPRPSHPLPQATQPMQDTFQFADDITHSHADPSLEVVGEKLVACFERTKRFCDEHNLVINADKTQLIIFKSPKIKLPDGYKLDVGGVSIEPATAVQLLGFTLDRHLNFGEHISLTSKKCNGVLGMLARAASWLPRDLLKLAYIALVRSQLEYCSAVLNAAAKTHLHKLDVIQKKASRIICQAPKDAHSDPLLALLQLSSLQSRRDDHILGLVDTFIAGNTHPALRDMFEVVQDGSLKVQAHRTVAAKRSFRSVATTLYNNRKAADTPSLVTVPCAL